jgi:hypothetical protein
LIPAWNSNWRRHEPAVDQPAGEALFNASKPDPWPKSASFVVPTIQGMGIRTELANRSGHFFIVSNGLTEAIDDHG